MESTERTFLKLHTHQILETRCIQRGSPYRTVICIGAVRSGKSLVIARWMIDRSQWDTAQMHGIFANTKDQLDSILQDVMPWIEEAGIEWQTGRQPPREWVERWRREKIPVPPRRPSYRGILILSTGFMAQTGGLEGISFRRFKGGKFSSVVLEEVTAGMTEIAMRYIMERVHCGLGTQRCKDAGHHHVKIIHANPPDEDAHWIYDWVKRQEQRVAKAVGREPGENYENLKRGLGDTIYIKSRTIDNAANLPEEFIDDIAGSVDEETAKRILDGDMTRRRVGRAYNAFTRANLYPIEYDPDRTLYLAFDFNTNPTVALLGHPLKPGEYPSEFGIPGAQFEGIFGEFFHVGGMDAHQLALALAQGGIGRPGDLPAGSGGHLPSNWKGIAKHRGPVIAFGDAKGGASKSITGFTPWSIVNEVMREAAPNRYSARVSTVNPLQQVRIRSLNARFCNSKQQRLLFIDEHLAELLLDLDTVSTEPDGTIKKPGGPRAGSKFWWRTHLSDALGYMECELHPMGHDVDPRANTPKIIRTPRTPLPSHL